MKSRKVVLVSAMIGALGVTACSASDTAAPEEEEGVVRVPASAETKAQYGIEEWAVRPSGNTNDVRAFKGGAVVAELRYVATSDESARTLEVTVSGLESGRRVIALRRVDDGTLEFSAPVNEVSAGWDKFVAAASVDIGNLESSTSLTQSYDLEDGLRTASLVDTGKCLVSKCGVKLVKIGYKCGLLAANVAVLAGQASCLVGSVKTCASALVIANATGLGNAKDTFELSLDCYESIEDGLACRDEKC
jgi:hypothetical protein